VVIEQSVTQIKAMNAVKFFSQVAAKDRLTEDAMIYIAQTHALKLGGFKCEVQQADGNIRRH
jgi:hypothetical protein